MKTSDKNKPHPPLMPKYKCHKIVRAMKIKSILPSEETVGIFEIHPVDPKYAPIEVVSEYVRKNHPDPGGYAALREKAHGFSRGMNRAGNAKIVVDMFNRIVSIGLNAKSFQIPNLPDTGAGNCFPADRWVF